MIRSTTSLLLLAFSIALLSPATTLAEDTVEFLSGAKVVGRVTEIRKAKKEIVFEAVLGTRRIERTYPYSTIHAVTYNGKRYVLNAKSAGASNGGSNVSNKPVERIERSRAEVQKIIETVGSTQPDWFNSVRLNYPRTLDFSWPTPAKKEWNNQKFVGHYVWDVINPNRSKWHEGVRLMHHIIDGNKSNAAAKKKSMNQLGVLYCSLLEDYPRAAYWWQKAGSGTSGAMGVGGYRVGYEVGLARCYWELGNRDLAVEMLNRARPGGTIHLWAEMGEHDRAINIARREASRWVGAYNVAGDICRHAGRFREAIGFYNQAIQKADPKKQERVIQNAKKRIIAVKAFETFDLERIRDGKYQDSSIGYAGLVHVSVTVKDKAITDVRVTKHVEKQYYSSLTDIPNQIIQKQSVKGIDATSSATITAEAIIRATAKALAK